MLLNGRDSFQLFVGVYDTCLVWYLLVLPSETYAVANMTSLRAIDGDISYYLRESFSFKKIFQDKISLKKLQMVQLEIPKYSNPSVQSPKRVFVHGL